MNFHHNVLSQEFQQAVQNVLISAGEYIRYERKQFDRKHIETKGVNELVTYVDKQVEWQLQETFRSLLPQSGFINEESGSQNPDSEFVWIIDPLDGTTNFIYEIPIYCISVALQVAQETYLAWVYDVVHQEMFTAIKGQGAFCNKKPLRVSRTATLEQALLATGFPYRGFAYHESYVQLLYTLIHQTRGIRRLGAAALDLAYTAAGRFDGFFESYLHPWDVAAGALLIQEAGGKVTDYHGTEHYLFGNSILATNGFLHSPLLSVIQKYID